MAGIDKLYVKSYEDYDEIRRWALVYYPELLLYFYDIDMTYSQFEKYRNEWAIREHKRAAHAFKTLCDGCTDNAAAAANVIKYYRNNGYECPSEQAKDEALSTIESYNRTYDEWLDMYSMPIMTTPLNVDRYLKWRCPVRSVREYLHTHCGVDEKYEFIYKLFFKGKKHFD